MSLRERLQEIEQSNNLELKRQVIELLVAGIISNVHPISTRHPNLPWAVG